MVPVPLKSLKKRKEWEQEARAWRAEEGRGPSRSTLVREGALGLKAEAGLDHHPEVARLAHRPAEATVPEAAAKEAEGHLQPREMPSSLRCTLLEFPAALSKKILRRFSTIAAASEVL